MKNKILLLGGSGTLGSAIIKSEYFSNLFAPSKKIVNILNQKQIEKFLIKKNIDLVIHCAALARVKECEKNVKKAISLNIDGIFNVVKSIINIKKSKKKAIKLIFLSSDAVYPSIKGNYKETDKPEPYNVYGWTKLVGEYIVRTLNKFVIVRTRFFNKNNIQFSYSAKNIYTSSLEVNELVKFIFKIINKNFLGIINVGQKKISDFHNYKFYKKSLKPCGKKKIFKQLNFKIATDASLNLKKLNKL